MPHSFNAWKRGVALLLAGGLLATNLSGSFAYAESTPPQESVPATAETAETATPTPLSQQAQAFVDAVAALDRNAMIDASNAWGLAHQAWMADLDNAVLESKLNEAIAAQEEACAPLYEAEDLYNQIQEAERSDERVQAAYTQLSNIMADVYDAMENPLDTAQSKEGMSLDEIVQLMYSDLPEAPTGYYLDSNGLPVVTGDTKISIEGWGTEDYSAYDTDSDTQVALDADLLEAASATASFPRMDGESYAIVPISIQVLYPANGSHAEIQLPDDVELLGYAFTRDNLAPATEEERQSMLSYTFEELAASVAGIYVKASDDFEVSLTYTDDSQTLKKTLSVTLDDNAPQSGILGDRFSQQTSAVSTYALAAARAGGLQVTQCVNTSVGWMNYLGGQPALCADHGKWAWGPGATYANKYPPVASYSAAGSVWVDASAFGKGWEADQATIWASGFHNGVPTASAASTYALKANSAQNSYYDRLAKQAEQYPDSLAAEILQEMTPSISTFANDDSRTSISAHCTHRATLRGSALSF